MSNKIRDWLGIAIIVSMAVVALSAVGYVKTYSRVSEPTSFRSFFVSAEGKVVAVPDIAQFSFSLITEGGKDVAALQKQNTEKMNKAIAFLKDKSIEEKDITTQWYNIDPRYSYFNCSEPGRCPPPEITGYTINQSVLVKVRNFDDIGNLLTGVVKEGANSVSQLTFTIDDRTEVENQAREEAIKKAKEKAEAIAKAGGFKLGRLLSISESGPSQPPIYPFGMGGGGYDMKAEQAAQPSIEPGSQDVIINVSLTYEIE